MHSRPTRSLMILVVAALALMFGACEGPEGPAGLTGTAGAAGAQGQQGAQGTQGSTGADGTQGGDGDQGAAGPQGDQGEQGTTGQEGPQGPAGVTIITQTGQLSGSDYLGLYFYFQNANISDSSVVQVWVAQDKTTDRWTIPERREEKGLELRGDTVFVYDPQKSYDTWDYLLLIIPPSGG